MMSNWQSFWSSQPKLFDAVMQKNAAFFAQKLLDNQYIQSGQRILDFGCGWGSLANELKGKVTFYLGLDISPSCINACKEKLAGVNHFHFDVIESTDQRAGLEKVFHNREQFDLVIILSVIQYFSDVTKVEDLLTEMKNLIPEKGKIILADVIQSEKNLFKDVLSNLKDSIQKKYFFSFLLFMIKARFSRYNQIRVSNHLLSVREEEIASICQKLDLQYEVMPICTLQQSRVSYCITK
jgi:cyclopropane fatty-acyl-phospholipid synthase-like methyltransferase